MHDSERVLTFADDGMAGAVQILPTGMTSLPIPVSWSNPAGSPPGSIEDQIDTLERKDERFLLQAFRSFSLAASSLEHSYGKLRDEVEHLHRELAESNDQLARKSEENRCVRDRLNRILDGLPCGVLVASSEGNVLDANPEALRLTGLRPGNIGCSSLPELPVEIQQLLERCALEVEPEAGIPSESGKQKWLSARRAPLDQDPAGPSIFILRDVTERKRLQETASRLQRDRALAEIATLLAHEIRNPLASLELFAGLLAESPLTSENREWVEQMQAGLRTLAATVNNVLDFHSLPELHRAPVDMGALLEWARNFFIPLAKQSQITLSLQNRLSGICFPADRHRLEQVFLNLVLNSVKAMPQGGWIQIAGHRGPSGDLQLSVSDTGSGIPVDDLPHIFEPGFSRRDGSPGLGLAVCKKIVEQHGGTISALNRTGGGAAFTLTFSMKKSAEGANR